MDRTSLQSLLSIQGGLGRDSHKKYLDSLRKEFEYRYWQRNLQPNLKIDDFEVIKTIGTGAFSTAFLVRSKQNFEFLAMKAVEKKLMVEKDLLLNLIHEKTILQSVEFPFVINTRYVCKDNVYIYFLMPLAVGGELYEQIKKRSVLAEDVARFYAAQVVLGLEYLHHCDIIHRDLKPENIFIFENGYIKIADFSISKKVKGKTWTLCGTPEYIAPEIIISKGYNLGVDWWAFGVLLYEMIVGNAPFLDTNTAKLYKKILVGNFKIPRYVSGNCKQLIKKLLVVDPTQRLGCQEGGAYDVKMNTWFKNTNWNALLHQREIPPYLPPADKDAEHMISVCSEVLLKQSRTNYFEELFKDF